MKFHRLVCSNIRLNFIYLHTNSRTVGGLVFWRSSSMQIHQKSRHATVINMVIVLRNLPGVLDQVSARLIYNKQIEGRGQEWGFSILEYSFHRVCYIMKQCAVATVLFRRLITENNFRSKIYAIISNYFAYVTSSTISVILHLTELNCC